MCFLSILGSQERAIWFFIHRVSQVPPWKPHPKSFAIFAESKLVVFVFFLVWGRACHKIVSQLFMWKWINNRCIWSDLHRELIIIMIIIEFFMASGTFGGRVWWWFGQPKLKCRVSVLRWFLWFPKFSVAQQCFSVVLGMPLLLKSDFLMEKVGDCLSVRGDLIPALRTPKMLGGIVVAKGTRSTNLSESPLRVRFSRSTVFPNRLPHCRNQ